MNKQTYKIYPTNDPTESILITPENRLTIYNILTDMHVRIINNYDEMVANGGLIPCSVNLIDGKTIELVSQEPEDEDTIRVCDWCHGEVSEVGCGDEGWSVCQDCGATEAGDTEMTVSEYEKIEK